MSAGPDVPFVDLADALRAIDAWKSTELGWDALRRCGSRRIEPPPEWQRKLHELRPILKRGFDPIHRHHYWEAIGDFDEPLHPLVRSAALDAGKMAVQIPNHAVGPEKGDGRTAIVPRRRAVGNEATGGLLQ